MNCTTVIVWLRQQMATAKYDWSGTGGNALPDPKIRNKSSSSVGPPPFQSNDALPQNSRCAGCPFHTCFEVPDQTKYLAHTTIPAIIVPDTANQVCDPDPLIREHKNVHAGHVVLISSQMSL